MVKSEKKEMVGIVEDLEMLGRFSAMTAISGFSFSFPLCMGRFTVA